MKSFKFLSENKKTPIQYVPIITYDTFTTYQIPLQLYGRILTTGVDLYTENMTLFSPIEFNLIDPVDNVGITYYYKITNIRQTSYNPVRITIDYSIKFPDTEYFCNFHTTERLFLNETI